MFRFAIVGLFAAVIVVSAKGGPILNGSARDSVRASAVVECISANCLTSHGGGRLEYRTLLFSTATSTAPAVPNATEETLQTSESELAFGDHSGDGPANSSVRERGLLVASNSESDTPVAVNEDLEWASDGQNNPIFNVNPASPRVENTVAEVDSSDSAPGCEITRAECGNTTSLLRIGYTGIGERPATAAGNSAVDSTELRPIPAASTERSPISVPEPSTALVLLAAMGGFTLCARRGLFPPWI